LGLVAASPITSSSDGTGTGDLRSSCARVSDDEWCQADSWIVMHDQLAIAQAAHVELDVGRAIGDATFERRHRVAGRRGIAIAAGAQRCDPAAGRAQARTGARTQSRAPSKALAQAAVMAALILGED